MIKKSISIFASFFASLAQSVEQLIRNEQVVGSSPIGGSHGRYKEIRPDFVSLFLNMLD